MTETARARSVLLGVTTGLLSPAADAATKARVLAALRGAAGIVTDGAIRGGAALARLWTSPRTMPPSARPSSAARTSPGQERQEEFIASRVAAGEPIEGLFPLSESRRPDYETWLAYQPPP